MQFREILCVQISAFILKIPKYLVTETRKQNQKFISSLSFRFGFWSYGPTVSHFEFPNVIDNQWNLKVPRSNVENSLIDSH